MAEAQATPIGRAVYAWGQGSSGQQGNGGTADILVPTGVPQLTALHAERGIERIYAGFEYAIAITLDGTVWAWGYNQSGQLGNNSTTNLNVPTQISQLTTLNQTRGIERFYTGSEHNMVITADGYVYGWGNGANGRLGNNSTAPVLVPTEITQLTALNNTRGIKEVFDGGGHTHVITADGYVYGWGNGADGRLGNNSGANVLVPTNIVQLTTLNATHGIDRFYRGAHHSTVITDDGTVFVWGLGNSGRLGNGSDANVMIPTEVPSLTALNIDRFYVGFASTLVITTSGAAFAWGEGIHGQIGNGVFQNVNVPTSAPVVTALFANYDLTRAYMMQPVASWLFKTDCNRVYVWGAGNFGRHGNGDTEHIPKPIEVPAVSALVEAGASFFVGGRFTFAFDPVELILVGLRKTLQMPEGTTPPTTASFDFYFTQIGNVNLGSGMTSRPTIDFPALSQNPVSLTLTGVDAVTANTVTMVSTLSLMDIFGTLVFPGGGVFVWNVHEVEGSSGLTDLPNFEVLYDDSRFQIRVHATSAGVVGAIEVFRLTYDNGQWIVASDDCKVAGLDFLNTYRRLTGIDPCPFELNGVEVTKSVVGEFADLSTSFSFTLTLTEHFLAPLSFPISAYIIDIDDDETYAPIPTSSHTFTLRHGERLVIPRIWAGTNFTVSEAAIQNFTPSYRVTIGGVQGSVVPGTLETALATGPHIIWDTGRNAADFTNTHNHATPTGLFITASPMIAAAVTALLLLALLAASRNRRRIEELPLVL